MLGIQTCKACRVANTPVLLPLALMIQVQVVNNAKFSAKGQTLGSQAIRIASQMLFTLTIPSMQRDSNSDHFPIAGMICNFTIHEIQGQ